MISETRIDEEISTSEILSHTEKMIEILGSKWTLLILRELYFRDDSLRFNELLHELEPVSSRTLSLQLKKLIKWDIIEKRVIPTSPPGVEYNLTNNGKELCDIMYTLIKWSFK